MPLSARNNPLTEKKLNGPGPADYQADFKQRKHPSWAFGSEVRESITSKTAKDKEFVPSPQQYQTIKKKTPLQGITIPHDSRLSLIGGGRDSGLFPVPGQYRIESGSQSNLNQTHGVSIAKSTREGFRKKITPSPVEYRTKVHFGENPAYQNIKKDTALECF